MRFRRGLLIAALLTLPIVAPSCSDDSSNSEERLDGDWQTGSGIALTFADGSWTVTEGDDQEPFDTGTFTFDGTTLTVDTNEGGQSCQAGDLGTYEVSFVDDDTVELALVDDECVQRGSDWKRGFTRADE